MTIISTTVKKNPLEEIPHSQQKSRKCSTWVQPHKQKNDLCSFPSQTIQYYSNPSLHPTTNAEDADVEWFYEDLQDLPELTPKRDVFFSIGHWNARVESQEISGVIGKFGFRVQNEAGQGLTVFCQENTLVIANTLFTQYKRWHHTCTSPDGQ